MLAGDTQKIKIENEKTKKLEECKQVMFRIAP